MFGEYTGHVLSAYGLVAIAVGGLIARALIEARRLRTELARVERDAAGRSR